MASEMFIPISKSEISKKILLLLVHILLVYFRMAEQNLEVVCKVQHKDPTGDPNQGFQLII
jgi:hypothetical protein